MTDVHFQHLMENFQSKEELKVKRLRVTTRPTYTNNKTPPSSSFSPQEFFLKVLSVFRNLMKLSIFPRDWNVMRLLTSK